MSNLRLQELLHRCSRVQNSQRLNLHAAGAGCMLGRLALTCVCLAHEMFVHRDGLFVTSGHVDYWQLMKRVGGFALPAGHLCVAE